MKTTNEKASRDGTVYHHGTTDPMDYQVDDVLMCITGCYGLREGALYIAQAVARRKAGGRILTKVTVSNNVGRLCEVTEPEGFLRRTRVLVEVMAPSGRSTLHSFPDAEEFDVWCAFTNMPPNWIRNKRYVAAEPSPPEDCRFTAMCVPGELDDGSDADWYVYDLQLRTSDKVGTGSQPRSLAIWTAREANRVQNEADRQEADHEPR